MSPHSSLLTVPLQFRGTVFVKSINKWKTTFLTVPRHGGYHDTEEQAARAFDDYLDKLGNTGEHKKLGAFLKKKWTEDPEAFVNTRRNFN